MNDPVSLSTETVDDLELVDEIGGKLTCELDCPFSELKDTVVATLRVRPAYSVYLSREQASQLRAWLSGLLGPHAADELQRLRDGILALQKRCCDPADDLCNGCKALLALVKDSP